MDAAKLFTQITKEIEMNQLLLPTLPDIAIRIQETMDRESSTVNELVSVISTDAALSVRLLKVANSPIYRGRVSIDDIKMAVTRLGSRLVRSLTNALVMQQLFETKNKDLAIRLRDLWHHSVDVAAISTVLAKRYTELKPDIALFGGLIHDIGILPLLVRCEEMPDIIAEKDTIDNLIGDLHQRIGKAIAENWDFQEDIISVVSKHDCIMDDPDAKPVNLTDVVIAANIISRFGSTHPYAQLNYADVPAFRRLNINPMDYDAIMTVNGEDINAVRDSLLQ